MKCLEISVFGVVDYSKTNNKLFWLFAETLKFGQTWANFFPLIVRLTICASLQRLGLHLSAWPLPWGWLCRQQPKPAHASSFQKFIRDASSSGRSGGCIKLRSQHVLRHFASLRLCQSVTICNIRERLFVIVSGDITSLKIYKITRTQNLPCVTVRSRRASRWKNSIASWNCGWLNVLSAAFQTSWRRSLAATWVSDYVSTWNSASWNRASNATSERSWRCVVFGTRCSSGRNTLKITAITPVDNQCSVPV